MSGRAPPDPDRRPAAQAGRCRGRRPPSAAAAGPTGPAAGPAGHVPGTRYNTSHNTQHTTQTDTHVREQLVPLGLQPGQQGTHLGHGTTRHRHTDSQTHTSQSSWSHWACSRASRARTWDTVQHVTDTQTVRHTPHRAAGPTGPAAGPAGHAPGTRYNTSQTHRQSDTHLTEQLVPLGLQPGQQGTHLGHGTTRHRHTDSQTHTSQSSWSHWACSRASRARTCGGVVKILYRKGSTQPTYVLLLGHTRNQLKLAFCMQSPE